MGKLKFTLGNLWFWASLIFVVFLCENMQYLTGNPMSGYNPSTLIILTVGAVACLFMFFFLHHKKNKMTFDWVLLPAISIVAGAFLLGIWLAKGNTYQYADLSNSIEVSFSFYEKLKASIILVVFLVFTYAYMFVLNTSKVSYRKTVWFVYAGIVAALISIAFSLATEMKQYQAIFKSDSIPSHISIDSFYGNKNYYGGVLFIGILSCIIANYYKPRLHWYVLMVAMLVILISTAAMLPSLILAIAVPLYFLEEIIRFSVLRKWKYSIFALISLLMILALVILFFFGSTHKWNGFIGLDVYISETFAKKNFVTLTGRTIIWEHIIPYCTNDPISMIFGHGFILTEKHILAITSAMNNGAPGVRTTHNGYLQVLFEYGMVGVIVHAILIVYFLFACVRLLLEKKFSFVFIHLFIVACCGVFNFCESSSFFDGGVKEIFMTIAFMMPVFTRYKMIKRPERIKEIQTLKADHLYMNPVRLGQTVMLVLMSLICVATSALLCTYTFDNQMMKYIVLNSLIGFGILALFVPYLVTLFYKNTERSNFVLHCVFNGLLMSAAVFILYIVMGKDATMNSVKKFVIPGVIFFILLVDTVVYALVKNGSIKEWAKVFALGGFVIPRYALLAGFGIPAVVNIALQSLGMMNWFVYLTNMVFSLVCFYFVLTLLPTKGGRLIARYFNELDLYNIKRINLLDEVYYG